MGIDISGFSKSQDYSCVLSRYVRENGKKARVPIGLSIHGDSKELIKIQKQDGWHDLIPTLPTNESK